MPTRTRHTLTCSVREEMAAGASFEDAVQAVQRTSVFTTHTPVPAGHDQFPLELARKYLGPYCARSSFVPSVHRLSVFAPWS